MPRPDPPLSTESVEELTASFQSNAADWMQYLSGSFEYTTELEGTIATLRNEVDSVQRNLHESTSRNEGIIEYQQGQIESMQRRNVELELDVRRLSAAEIPANQPISTTSTPPTEPEIAPATTVSSATTVNLKEKQPDPKEFDGNRKDLRRFTQQIHGKMLVNGDRFPTATHRLVYVAGRLTGRAYDLILPKISHGIPMFADYTDLLAYLEQAFGDSDRVQNAQSKLFNLKQKNQEFSTYLAEFQSLALDGEMPESALTPLLYQGVSRELQDMLLHNPPTSQEFHAFANHLHVLDNRYRRHQQQSLRSRTTQSSRPANTTTTTTTTAALPARPVAAVVSQSTRSDSPRPVSSTTVHYDPMDLSSQRTTPASGRRERGECFRCGSKTHLVSRCPEPDTRPLLQARSSQLYSVDSQPIERPDSPPASVVSVASSINGSSLN